MYVKIQPWLLNKILFQKAKTRPGEVVQLVECLPTVHVALSATLALHNMGVVSCSLSKGKQRREKFKVFSHTEQGVNPGYTRLSQNV